MSTPTTKPLAIVEKLRQLCKLMHQRRNQEVHGSGDWHFYNGKEDGFCDAAIEVESDPELFALQASAERVKELQHDLDAGMVSLNEAGKFNNELLQKLVAMEEHMERLKGLVKEVEPFVYLIFTPTKTAQWLEKAKGVV